VILLRELKTAFAPYGFLLTAAVSPGKTAIDLVCLTIVLSLKRPFKFLDFCFDYSCFVGSCVLQAYDIPAVAK
jgi:hypothetical protein